MFDFRKKLRALVWASMEQSEYRSYRKVHPFDERYGVDTSGLIYDLATGHRHDACSNGYFAVAPSVFRQLLEGLELDWRQFTFVDLGSGKGRTLLLASDYPFREVLGVELSPQLHRIARNNIRRYRKGSLRPSPISSVHADAGEFCWPPGPLVVYMWNPFTEPVMERVLSNLGTSFARDPREIYVIYIHPELEGMLDRLPWLRKQRVAAIEMSEEDYSAWAFPERTEFCAVYQTTCNG